jgi:hypothetical protein
MHRQFRHDRAQEPFEGERATQTDKQSAEAQSRTRIEESLSDVIGNLPMADVDTALKHTLAL